MADSTITGLGAVTAPVTTDVTVIVSGGVTKKITLANFVNAAGVISKVTITPPTTGSTLTIIDGKTLTINKTISFTAADDTGVYTLPTGTKTLLATDGSAAALTGLPISTGVSGLGIGVATWLATPSSANLRAVLTDENGTGVALFDGATTPTFTTGIQIGGAAASRKMLVGNGTNFIPSTETWAVPGTSGNVLTSDGTNWTSAAPAAAAAGSLTGNTLAAGVTASSLTSFGASPSFTTPTLGVATGTRLGLGQAAGASNPLEITAGTDATGIKLLNSSQSPILDIYTSNANSSARNWRIATNFNSFGSMEFIRGTSQGAAPSSTAITINVSGDLGVNTTDEATSATAAAFTVAGGAGFSKKIFVSTGITDAGGTPGSLCYNTATFEVTKNNALTCTVSALEYKTAVSPLVDGLDVVLQMNPSQFAYKDNETRLRWGFVADDLQDVDAKLADNYDDKGHAKSIDLAAISAISVKAIQELNDKVGILEARILVLSEQVK